MAKDERDPSEDIPPVHVLEAMHEQDKKETADLLSGFDRPGRTPRKPPPQRDFVDYYANKESSPRAAPPSSRRAEPGAEGTGKERPTVLVSRRRDWRAVVVWAAAAFGMLVFAAVIAILATPDEPRPRAAPTIVPSSATTITSGVSAPTAIATADAPDEPSGTAATTVIVATPPVTAKPAKAAPQATAAASASTGAPPTIKTAPRDDFIRDL